MATAMRVLGKDRTQSAYRVGVDLDGQEVVALVSDALLSAEYGTEAKVPHQAAYEWIEAQAHRLHDAIALLQAGGTPRPPFDQITLDGAR